MKRRAFLRDAVVWTGLLWLPRAFGQQSALAPRVRQFRRAGSSLSCQSDEQSTTDNDYYPTSTNIAQKVRTLSGEVCEVRLKLQWLSGSDVRAKVQLWSAADRTGTQYGSDSGEVTLTSGGYQVPAWATFTFATAPAPPGDFWICLVQAGADNFGWRIDYNHTAGAGFYPYTDASGDQAYCAYAYGANRTTTDCAFDVRTLQ